MRKIIQIALGSHPQEHSPLYALCDDGTVWQNTMVDDHGRTSASPRWKRIDPSIPNDDAPDPLLAALQPLAADVQTILGIPRLQREIGDIYSKRLTAGVEAARAAITAATGGVS